MFEVLKNHLFLRAFIPLSGFVAPAVCMFLMSALSEEDWVSHVALLAIGMTLHETAITGPRIVIVPALFFTPFHITLCL